jgi:hypothetical protein
MSNDLGLLPVLSTKDDDKNSNPHLVSPSTLSFLLLIVIILCIVMNHQSFAALDIIVPLNS